jgi:hypothetical protein
MSQLKPIASEMVRLCDQRALTPVIVSPKYLALRPIFLVELCHAVLDHAERGVRIDWCRPMPSARTLLSDQLARVEARAINRHLKRLSKQRSQDVRLQITASIARPGGANRQLVIGWCGDDFKLPPWAAAIELSGEPMSSSRIAA